MPVKNYRDLLAWQKAMDFVEAIYKVTKAFPREELYGLTISCAGAASRFPRTSRKDKVGALTRSSHIVCP